MSDVTALVEGAVSALERLRVGLEKEIARDSAGKKPSQGVFDPTWDEMRTRVTKKLEETKATIQTYEKFIGTGGGVSRPSQPSAWKTFDAEKQKLLKVMADTMSAVNRFRAGSTLDRGASGMLLCKGLYEAVTNNNVDVIKKLLSRGVDVNWNNPDEGGYTVLHAAASQGFKETLSVLLDAGADKNERDDYGLTPLHVASLNGEVTCATALVGRGADLNLKENYGLTPLHTAALNGKKAMVEALVNMGASVDVVDMYGKKPVDVAKMKNYSDIVGYLVKISTRQSTQAIKKG